MTHKKLLRKVCSVGLCLCLLLSSLPTGAVALTEDGLCDHHPEHSEECGYVEGESTCGYVCEECAQQEQPEEPEENPVEEPQEEPEEPENAPVEEPTPISGDDEALTEETATVKAVIGDSTTYYASFDAYMASEQYAISGNKAVTILKDTSVNTTATLYPDFIVNHDVTLTLNADLTVLPDSLAGGLSVYGTIDGEGTLNYAGLIGQGTFKCPVNMEGGIPWVMGGLFYNSVTIYGEKAQIESGIFFDEVTISGGATIVDGTFEGAVTNSGATIAGGTFNGTVKNQNVGEITGGTFSGEVDNYARILGGTFNGSVENYGMINAGTFNDTVTNYYHAGNDYEGILGGGTFNAKLINYGFIFTDTGYTFALNPNFSIVNYAIDADYGPEDGKLIICTSHIQNDSGICRLCGDGCSHTSWTGEVCDGCGKACVHTYENGTCIKCGKACIHTYENGTCTKCGTKEPPALIDGCYQIVNASQLQWFAQQVNAGNGNINGKLTENIDLSDIANWTPIGTEGNPYTGTFDGNNQSITAMAIEATSNNQGLFGVVNGGTVKNFTIQGEIFIAATAENSDDNTYNGIQQVGGAVGYAYGGAKIDDVTSNVGIEDTGKNANVRNQAIGGVVGLLKGSTVSNCTSTEYVTMQMGSQIGGIVGTAQDKSVIEYCVNRASVYSEGATHHIGGVAGSATTGTTVSCCLNRDDVTSGGGDCVGGVVGYSNENVSIANCGNYGIVYCMVSSTAVGGILGYVNNANFKGLENSINIGTIKVKDGVGGAIVGNCNSGTKTSVFKNNYYLNTSCANVSNTQTIQDAYSVVSERILKGEITWLLNEKSSTGPWKQTIKSEPGELYTGPNFDGEAVYYGYTSCDDMEKVYTNDKDAQSEPVTHIYDENGFCTSCDGYEPATNVGRNEYQISNAGQLFWFAENFNNHQLVPDTDIELTADIDLENREFTPIGWDPDTDSSSNLIYRGRFHGKNHVIKNLNVKATGTCEAGLFSRVGDDAALESFGVVNATITSEGGVRAGVIAGEIYKANVTNVFTAGDITITTTHDQKGGIAGECAGSALMKCFTTYGCLTSSSTAIAENSFHCFYMADSENPNSHGEFKTKDQFEKGEVAYLLSQNNTGETWKQNLGTDAYPSFTGSKVYAGYTSCADSAELVYTNDSDISKTKPAHAYDGAGFCSGCDGYQPCTGAGTEASPYLIANAGNLYWFAQQVNSGYTTIHGKLTQDITVNTGVLVDGALNSDTTSFRKWTPIGTSKNKYLGTFDGNRKVITGLYYNDGAGDFVGLFGYVGYTGSGSNKVGGTVKNVTVKDSYFCGTQRVGAIVGMNDNGLVDNCHNSKNIVMGSYAGGIVGTNRGTITRCTNSGNILIEAENTAYIGGIAGLNSGEITQCSNSGVIRAESLVGGISGANYKKIVGCYNTGKISGEYDIGGIVGINQTSATVSECCNTNEVSGNREIGGIVGQNYNSGDQVTNCYNTGAVTGTGDDSYDIGGVVGNNSGKVSYCRG